MADDEVDATTGAASHDHDSHEDLPCEADINTKQKAPGSSRKRTKTGCLTCRRRRIKCGEERPICGNCIKSKRQCEGYNQRVVFKEPVITWRGSTSSSAAAPQFAIHAHQEAAPVTFSQAAPGSSSTSHLANIRPKPSAQAPFRYGAQEMPYVVGSFDSISPEAVPNMDRGQSGHLRASEPCDEPDNAIDSEAPTSDQISSSSVFLRSYQASQNWPLYLAQQSQPYTDPGPQRHPNQLYHETTIQTDNSDSNSQRQQPDAADGTNNVAKQLAVLKYRSQDLLGNHDDSNENVIGDDPFDVTDDDDEAMSLDDNVLDVNDQDFRLEDQHMATILSLQLRSDRYSHGLRTYHSVIDSYGPDMLTFYHPSAKDSPLNNSTAARVFQHFINVLGPTISTNERNPANPALLFQGFRVPPSQQHVWTYTMPKLALHDQALMHAMLAVSSFHIAKLQDIPVTASLKHYHVAIRRVAKNISSPTKRLLPNTLGAIMLLGFYELMSAEHQKWSDHLLGATLLIRQINFKEVAEYIKTRKIQRRQLFTGSYPNLPVNVEMAYDESGDDEYTDPMEEDVDENLVSVLSGEAVTIEQRGRVLEDDSPSFAKKRTYTKQDLATYETQRDLFWWYCKQDTYQSVLSGNRLFMSYDQWRNCLPRAPVGRLHAIYGTYDHVMLLFGRVAEFAAKDLKRKRQVMQANGGQWRPPAGMPMPPLPRPPKGAGPSKGSSISMFPGMMPETGKASLPRGFSPTREPPSPESSDSTDSNLERRFREAEDEWSEIRGAFDVLEAAFGPDFEPLGSEHIQPMSSPFGDAMQFRTYGVAGIWMNFYMALTACIRAHPNMPPAAMMAAGISARQTEVYAQKIGRISAGIVADCSVLTEVNTQVGASLIETTIALFMAGVQFHDSAQRHWTVQRLLDITRLTGWQTGTAICIGVETAWVKAAELGRGPPYQRSPHVRSPHNVPWAIRRRLDGVLMARSGDPSKMMVSKQERVHYVMGLLGVEDDFQKLELPDQ